MTRQKRERHKNPLGVQIFGVICGLVGGAVASTQFGAIGFLVGFGVCLTLSIVLAGGVN